MTTLPQVAAIALAAYDEPDSPEALSAAMDGLREALQGPQSSMPFACCLRDAVRPHGSAQAARICGVTQRCINLWIRGKVTPNLATQTGALVLLRQAPIQPSKTKS